MKIDKKKMVFASIIGVVVLFIIAYSTLIMGGGAESDNILEQTAVPQLEEQQQVFESKKDAVDAIRTERNRNAPSIYDEMFLDSLGQYDPDLLDREKQAFVDSIYRLGKIDYSDDSYKADLTKRTRTLSKDEIDPEENEIDSLSVLKKMAIEQQLFFAVSPQVLAYGTGQALEVEIDGEQTIKINDRLQMRVTENTTVQGIEIKKNTLLYGIVKFRPNRVILEVSNIEGFPLKMRAYDRADGLEGIYIRNSFRGDVFNEVLGDVIEDINVPGVPQVSGVKKIFQRNNRNVRVSVSNNYKLILKPQL